MMTSKVTFNLDGLQKFKKDMVKTYSTRVGIMDDKATRKDVTGTMNNAEIGFIQIMGSLTHNIPPRDFLRFPIEHERRDIMKTINGSQIVKKAIGDGDIKKVFKLLGIAAEAAIKTAFQTGGFGQWKPLSPRTIAAKGSAAILIDSGQLHNAIDSKVVKKGQS